MAFSFVGRSASPGGPEKITPSSAARQSGSASCPAALRPRLATGLPLSERGLRDLCGYDKLCQEVLTHVSGFPNRIIRGLALHAIVQITQNDRETTVRQTNREVLSSSGISLADGART